MSLREGRVAADSIYSVLHRECFTLFPDEMFADLFTDVGRRSVPPMIVPPMIVVLMVLQRVEGCSDREAVDRFTFDARWKYAAGGLDFDYPGFVHPPKWGATSTARSAERQLWPAPRRQIVARMRLLTAAGEQRGDAGRRGLRHAATPLGTRAV